MQLRGQLQQQFSLIRSLPACSTMVLALLSSAAGAAEWADITAEAEAVLAQRMQSSTGQQWELTLVGAALHHDTKRRFDPTGRRFEDLQLSVYGKTGQWPRIDVGTPAGSLAKRLYVPATDASALVGDADALQGELVLSIGRQSANREMGQGENSHSMMKAGRQPVMDWHIGGRKRVQLSKQRLHIETKVLHGQIVLDMELTDFAGDARPASPPAANDTTMISWDELGPMLPRSKRSLRIRLQRNDKGVWALLRAWTPSWNLATHGLQEAKLTMRDDRLQGVMVPVLNPDPWVPKVRRPQPVTVSLDVPVVAGAGTGTYQATMPDGKQFSGQVSFTAWTPVVGEFSSQGVDGSRSGRVRGRVRGLPAKPAHLPATAASKAAACIDDRDAQPGAAAFVRTNALALAAELSPLASERQLVQGFEVQKPQGDAAALQAYADDLQRFARAALGATGTVQRGIITPEDADFGPYSPTSELPPHAQTAHVLSPVDTKAPQQWARLTRWQCIGPFVAFKRARYRPSMVPQVMPTPAISYQDKRRKFAQTVHTHLQWQDVNSPNGILTPPQADWQNLWISDGKMSSYSKHPVNKAYLSQEYSSRSYQWYAKTQVHAAEAGRYWLAVRVGDAAALWLGGRLVWESGERHDPRLPAVFAVPLQAGANEVLLRCDKYAIGYAPPNGVDRSQLRVWLCTAGAPRSAEQLAIDHAAEKTAAAQADPQPPRGYGAGGEQVRSNANPPVAWNLEKDRNVAWRFPVRSGAVPVIAGDHVFVTSEPHTLHCLSLQTGKELWQRTVNVMRIREKQATSQNGVSGDDFATFIKDLRNLRAMHAELPTGKDKNAEREAQLPALQSLWGRMSARAEQLKKYGIACSGRVGRDRGPSLGQRAGAAPVSDGKRCWVAFGTGAVACFDTAGQEVWSLALQGTWEGASAYAPLLIDNVLVVVARLPPERGRRDTDHLLLGLDAQTGAELWRSDALSGVQGALTSVTVRGDGRIKHFIISAAGRVHDPATGRVLFEGIFSFPANGREAPTSEAQNVYLATAAGQECVRFWLEADGRLACRQLWAFRRNGHAGRRAVVADGLLYVPRVADEFHSHNPVAWDQLDVYDADAGHHLAKPKPVIRDGLTPAPITAIGPYLYFGDHGGGGMGIKTPKAQMAVLTRGVRPSLLTTMNLGSNRLLHEPVGHAEHLLLRFGGEIVCIRSIKDAEGDYEEEALAEVVLRQIGRAPRVNAVMAIPAASASADPVIEPLSLLFNNLPPSKWLHVGPLPTTDGDLLQELGGQARLRARNGLSFTLAGQSYAFAQLDKKYMMSKGLAKVAEAGGQFYRPAYGLDFIGAAQRKSHTTSYFYAMWQVNEPGVWKYHLRARGVTSWLSGKEVKPGQLLRLAAGYHPLILRVDLGRIPPVGKPTIAPVLMRVQDPEKLLQDWKDLVIFHQQRLQRIIDRMPAHALAIYARDHLKKAGVMQ